MDEHKDLIEGEREVIIKSYTFLSIIS